MPHLARSALACALFIAASGTTHAATKTVSVTTTTHGIPHIVAADYRSLGFGYGYTIAENDLCGMEAMFATYSGERALHLGEQGSDVNYLLGRRPLNNATSDFVMRLMIGQTRTPPVERPELRELMRGYAQGFNSYLAATTSRPAACRDRKPMRPISVDDIQRRLEGFAMLLSSGLLLQEIYDAAPPASGPTQIALAAQTAVEFTPAGSNAYAFGKDATDNARGLLLGNPHFFWDGPHRFVQMHLTVPGKYDAMGVAVQGVPLVMLGFNQSLAWTHTVSTDKRGALYRLALDPNDPTRYQIDGRSMAMTRKRVTIRVRTATGEIAKRSHEFWMTRFGPVVASPRLPWTRQHAFVLSDANQGNDRLLQQWLAIGQSRDVHELQRVLKRTLGLPWVNTIAADQQGDVLYADLSVAANFDSGTLRKCAISAATGFENFLAVLDGSRAACFASGWLPADARPTLMRKDFVANSNDSHWLTQAASPLEGFSPVIGAERTAQKFRTRQGQIQVRELLSGSGGGGRLISQATLKALMFSNRSLQAELVVERLLASCAPAVEQISNPEERDRVTRGCQALRKWDLRYELDSVGAHVFSEFANFARTPGSDDLGTSVGLWKVPFDAADPLFTPREFDASQPAVWKALGLAVARLEQANIPLEAKLGEVQFVVRNGQRIPLHGGATYSSLHATLVPGVGYTEPFAPSNAYLQVVAFDDTGPIADAILASSQSPDVGSPYHADQTLAYSRKEWTRLPFTPAEIAAAAIAPPRVLKVPRR